MGVSRPTHPPTFFPEQTRKQNVTTASKWMETRRTKRLKKGGRRREKETHHTCLNHKNNRQLINH